MYVGASMWELVHVCGKPSCLPVYIQRESFLFLSELVYI